MALAHSERDYIPYVFACLVANNGTATFHELREYIEDYFPLNRSDHVRLPSLGCPTWHQRLRNLKSNKTLWLNFGNISEVPGGFKLNKTKKHSRRQQAG